jgi:RNA recognition motif-containing protein
MNIYVGNIPYNATEQDLRGVFQRFGKVVSVAIVIDRRTNKSLGYGFIDMPEDHNALKAIKELDGAEFHGRSLRVDQSQPRTDRRTNSRDRRTTSARGISGAGSSERRINVARRIDNHSDRRKVAETAPPPSTQRGLIGFFKRLLGS